ncbi:hypothetical protein [Rhodopila globiformis]|uniref:hypothetical protein n=1 Tax=Rhodopila globiformis TaxID=1071 RepID=UPI0011B0A7F9|nr:hypothetical protein [Rhodopila globiformis]
MDSRRLQDRLYFGLGRSARHVGQPADAFRPDGPFDPLKRQNRFLRLPAAFVPAKGGVNAADTYGRPLWHGIFDASYTRTGDYLVLESDTYFIASQAPLLPVLCVTTNRTISIARPTLQTSTGENNYGGFTVNGTMPLMELWPASVLSGGRGGSTSVGLPTDQATMYLDILVPAPNGILLLSGDRISDDLGQSAIISSAELTSLGWRITAKMATT